MRKSLTRTGNSVALVLDRPLLKAVGIAEGDEVDVSTNGDVIVITPARSRRQARELGQLLDEIEERYAGVFSRLAE